MEGLSKLHPLLIDHVLDKIFGDACFFNSEFFRLRKVCLAWNIAATKKCRLSMSLFEQSHISKIKDHFLLLQNPGSNLPPLKKLDLSVCFFPDYNCTSFNSDFGNFLGLVADQLEDLRIEFSESSTLLFEEDCYQLGRFTRLQTLTSEVVPNSRRSRFRFLSSLIEIILVGSVVLHKLLIIWNSRFGCYWAHLGNKVLRNIPKSVKHLTLQAQVSRDDFEVLISLNLPNLTSLSLILTCADYHVSGDGLCCLFSNSKNLNLVELELGIHNDLPIESFRLPIFPNLKTLKLGALNEDVNVQLPNMSFSTLFPKVTEFYMAYKYQGGMWTNVKFLYGAHAPLVDSCTLPLYLFPQYDYFNGFTGMTKLVLRSIIRLTELAGLVGVFRHHDQLQHLELELEYYAGDISEFPNLDSVLTGIPATMCESIRNNPEWTVIPISTIKVDPGLSDLMNLKFLSIQSQVPSNITDVTAQFGFLQLPELKELVVEEFNMSQTCIKNLKMKFGERTTRRGDRKCDTLW